MYDTTATPGQNKRYLILLCAAALTLLIFSISLFIGKYPMSPSLLLEGDAQAVNVFLTLRLPRVFMAVLSGFALGAAGSVYQTVFRNPLASPDIIGAASGASTGAAFAILYFSSSPFLIMSTSFLGGLAAVALSLGISSLATHRNGAFSLVLSGIAVNALSQTLLMLLKLTADPEKELASIEYWIMGSLNGITRSRIPMTVIVSLFGLLALSLLYRQVLLLSVEDAEARMLGVSVGRVRALVLLLATLVTASVISLTGVISFVGLLAPHTARLLMRDNRIPTFLLSGLLGSLLLTAADIFARSAAAGELPVSIFTSLLGVPFLLFLILRRNTQL